MMKLTPTQRALAKYTPGRILQARLDLDAITRRPAYHLCCVWLEQRELVPAPIGYPHWRWIPVSWVANVMKHTFGGYAEEMTMALALEHNGVEIRIDKKGHLEANLYELVLLEALRSANSSGIKPRPLLEFSDFEPVDPQEH